MGLACREHALPTVIFKKYVWKKKHGDKKCMASDARALWSLSPLPNPTHTDIHKHARTHTHAAYAHAHARTHLLGPLLSTRWRLCGPPPTTPPASTDRTGLGFLAAVLVMPSSVAHFLYRTPEKRESGGGGGQGRERGEAKRKRHSVLRERAEREKRKGRE